MGLYSWLLAQSYDWAMCKTEQRCLNRWRRELLTQATGELLEIGAGTGTNIALYPAQLTKVTLSEPNLQMRRKLRKKLTGSKRNFHLTDWAAEQIEQPDHSFDTIVCSLVLCSVGNQQRSLREIFRLLRPGGQLLFLEHVIAKNEQTIRRQHLFEPIWRYCSGNCHLTRDTLHNIKVSGMVIEELTEANILGAPSILRRSVRGRARKPGPAKNSFGKNG